MSALVAEAKDRLETYRTMQSLKADSDGPKMAHSALSDVPEASTRGLSGSAVRNAGKGIGTVNGSSSFAKGGNDDFSDIDVGPREKAPATPAWEQPGGVSIAAPILGGGAATLNAHAKAFSEEGTAAGPNQYRDVQLSESHHGEAGGVTMMTGLGEQSERSTLETLPDDGNAKRVAAESRMAKSMGMEEGPAGGIDTASMISKLQERRQMGQPFGTPATPDPAALDQRQPTQERRLGM